MHVHVRIYIFFFTLYYTLHYFKVKDEFLMEFYEFFQRTFSRAFIDLILKKYHEKTLIGFIFGIIQLIKYLRSSHLFQMVDHSKEIQKPYLATINY